MGLFDLMDECVTEFYKIDLDLMTYISQNATDEELKDFVEPMFKGTISNMKKGIIVRNKYRGIYQ